MMESHCNFSQFYSFKSLPKIQVLENDSLIKSPEFTDDKNFFQGLAFGPVLRKKNISIEEVRSLSETSIKPSPYKILPWIFSNFSNFKLELFSKNITPINKCKYFSLKVGLKDENGLIFPISEEIYLKLKVYNQDGQELHKNLKGDNIIKGEKSQKLAYYTSSRQHCAIFKIQITEVSSHHVQGIFTFKVVPILPKSLKKAGWSISPCVIPNIVVLSKPPKSFKNHNIKVTKT